MRWLALALMMAGCGEGGDSEQGGALLDRSPEEYVPASVSLDGLTEAQRICVLDFAVTYARVQECDPTGPDDATKWVREDGSAFWRSTCTYGGLVTMEAYTPPAEDEHVARCLDFRASAPCADLVVPLDRLDPANIWADCPIVLGSW